MKLNLFEDKNNIDEHVDVYFSNMRPQIKQKMIIVRLLFMPECLQEIKKMTYIIRYLFYGSFAMLEVLL